MLMLHQLAKLVLLIGPAHIMKLRTRLYVLSKFMQVYSNHLEEGQQQQFLQLFG